MFFPILGLCDRSSMLYVFLVIKIFINIICVIVPIIFLYRAILPFFNVTVKGKEIKGELVQLLKSFVASLIIFLIPGLLNYFFTSVLNEDITEVSTCYTNATMSKIEELRKKEEEEREKQKQQEKEEKERLEKELREKEEKDGKINRAKAEEWLEKYGKQDEESIDGVAGTSGRILKSSANNIIIGDSRTVGMCAAITGTYNGCSFNSSGVKYVGNDIFIAQGSMGYSWFNSSAIPAVNAIIAANPDVTYNIFSLMGVNYLLSDLNNYIPAYNNLANGEWSNHNLILVSVNPVNENIEAQHGYSTKNANIISFNNQLKEGTSGHNNVMYCDTYSVIINTMNTSDGLHYDSATYKDIYNAMLSCAK